MNVLLPLAYLFLSLFSASVFSAEENKAEPEGRVVIPEIKDERPPAEAQMAFLKDHFPEGLLDADGKAVGFDSLKGKVVGIYFSAEWCGPCRTFSLMLFEHREKYADDFQVVFVSSDRSDEMQSRYMKKHKMNCPTMKRNSPAADALAVEYGVRDIPTLILFDHKGNFISRDGRGLITRGVDMAQITSGKTSIVKEGFLCSKCDEIHIRYKVVAEDPIEQAKFK